MTKKEEKKRCSGLQKLMSKTSLLLILVWDASVNTMLMILRDVYVPCKCCMVSFSTAGNQTCHYIFTFYLFIFPPTLLFSTAVIKPAQGERCRSLKCIKHCIITPWRDLLPLARMQQSLLAATLTLSDCTFPIVSGNADCINVKSMVMLRLEI